MGAKGFRARALLRALPKPALGDPDAKLRGPRRAQLQNSENNISMSSKLDVDGVEYRVVRKILKREATLRDLENMCSVSRNRPFWVLDAVDLLLSLRQATVETIEAILLWRKPHVKLHR